MNGTITNITIDKSIAQLNAEGAMIRAQAAMWLTEHFGERCKEFNAECICCKRWAAMDVLCEEV